jgi:hypothetical protein
MRFFALVAAVLTTVWGSVMAESQQVNYFLVDGVKYYLNSDLISKGVSFKGAYQRVLINGVDIVGSNVGKMTVFVDRNDVGMNDPGRSAYEFLKSGGRTLEVVEATNDFVVYRSDEVDLKKNLIFKDLRDDEYFYYDCMFQFTCSIRGTYERKIRLRVDFHPGEKKLSNDEVLKIYRAVKHIVFEGVIMSGEVPLSNEQRDVIRNYVSQGDYASGYRYVAHIVVTNIVGGDATGDPRTANWLEIAAAVNSDDGSFRSDFVHYATTATREMCPKAPSLCRSTFRCTAVVESIPKRESLISA